MTDFFISVSKTTVDAACSHEIRGQLLLGRNLDSMLKNRDIILPTKVHIVKAIVFSMVMYGVRARP